MNWLARNTDALQALGAIITALVALAALIAIPLQINANATLQSQQSARDIYREYLALSVQQPQFGAPDYCALQEDPKTFAAYAFYVDYLIYTAEQVTTLSDDWTPVMVDNLERHAVFICENLELRSDSPEVAAMLPSLTQAQCQQEPSC